MRVVVGLGNPGNKYHGTRHNVGFAVVDGLASSPSAGKFQSRFQAQVAEMMEGDQKVLLVKPETFMNLERAEVSFARRWSISTSCVVDRSAGGVRRREPASLGNCCAVSRGGRRSPRRAQWPAATSRTTLGTTSLSLVLRHRRRFLLARKRVDRSRAEQPVPPVESGR